MLSKFQHNTAPVFAFLIVCKHQDAWYYLSKAADRWKPVEVIESDTDLFRTLNVSEASKRCKRYMELAPENTYCVIEQRTSIVEVLKAGVSKTVPPVDTILN